MLKLLKATAVLFCIAVAAVAILVFGSFLGFILVFLGPVIVISFFLWIIWLIYQEDRNEQ